MIRRALPAIVVWAMSLASGLAAQPAPQPPVVVTPAPVPQDGTVIKPTGPVDPGIQAKTPSPSHFPTPVIRPTAPVEPPPR